MKNLILKVTASKWNYYLSLMSDFLVGILFLILSISYANDFWATVALFTIGFIFFTFLEYAVHAWLFHKKHSLEVFIEGHAHHHQNPFSHDAMPFFMSAVIATLFVFLFKMIMPVSDALALVGGLALGYSGYGIMHHIMHRKEFKSVYWRYMQEFHFVHHKRPEKNMGITTDIWDRIFGTYYQWKDNDLKGIEKLKRVKE